MPFRSGVPVPLPPILYQDVVRRALQEDLGLAGDLTSDAIVDPRSEATALMVARCPGRVAGVHVAAAAFLTLDPSVKIETVLADGQDAPAGATVARVSGPAHSILVAERTALNFFGRLSGIATVTRDVVALVAPFGTRVTCTRKTTPGLRALEKYAVRVGGGANHRFGLDDAVLIKDNHRAVAGSISAAVERVRRHVGHMVKVEVEVDTLEELEEALRCRVDAVLLDNMPPAQLREAVQLARGNTVTEASGGITPANVAEIAAAGVDVISLGWLTHSAPALDVALDIALQL